MTTAQTLGISTGEMKNALETVSVRGRTEIIPTGRDFIVMLDYAHNGVAMENLLAALREYQPGGWLQCLAAEATGIRIGGRRWGWQRERRGLIRHYFR